MNDILSNIYARRSIRAYSPEGVPEDIIMEILRAGTFAPNGMNTQPLRFVVITNRERIKECSSQAANWWLNVAANPPKGTDNAAKERMEAVARRFNNPSFDMFYGAPVLVFVFTAPNSLTPNEDGTLAAENMMLAARSYGLGSCWIGFAKPLGNDKGFLTEMGVPADHVLIAPLVFGFPKGSAQEGKREAPRIMKWVR